MTATRNGHGSMRRVVVTGMATINPMGSTLDEYWDGLIEGRSTARVIERFDTSRCNTKFACQVTNFEAGEHLERKLVARNGRFVHFAMVAAADAVGQAGLDIETEDPFRAGVELGTGIGGFTEFAQSAVEFAGGARLSPFFIPIIIPNMAASQVAMLQKLKGPNSTVVTACAASTQAIGNAFRIVQRGGADVMLAGGTEANLSPMGVAAFNAIKALSTRNEDPETASRPFDKDRDGFVPGEGCGILILESLEHAQARGAEIWAEIVGYGCTEDAFHQVAPDDTGEPASRCIKAALADAGIEPDEVDYVNAHGTSTQLNDAAETKALKMALGEHARKVAISSTKSMIGHLLGAAGAVEAIATLLCMRHGMAHPTINYTTPDPDCDLDYIPNKARRMEIRVAISNGFGFGGQNAVLAFRRFES